MDAVEIKSSTPDRSSDSEARERFVAKDTPLGASKKRENTKHGAQAVPHYEDRHEDYILVTADDLREIRAFGWLQQSIFGTGAFFFSGAFWLFCEILSNQQKFEFTPWMGMCAVSMVFGAVLVGVSGIMFWLKQKRQKKYVSKAGDLIPRPLTQ
jgi:hypothetical protein